MRLFYTIGIFFYRVAIAIAALFQKKAKMWQQGRKGEFARLSAAFAGQPRPVWVHSASLGEYEQARPLIERIKRAPERLPPPPKEPPEWPPPELPLL